MGWSDCLLLTRKSPAETSEPIEMLVVWRADLNVQTSQISYRKELLGRVILGPTQTCARSNGRRSQPYSRGGSRRRDAASVKGKGNPYSTAECRVPELIAVLGSQPAGDASHKPGGRLPLLSARPAVTPATLNRAVTNFAAW